jgi:tripartite-type tricarboxylate transporter receptor subunit TctC
MRCAIAASRASSSLVAASVFVYTAACWAQPFPVKPVRYVVPFPAGTVNDIVGRLFTDRLAKMWIQEIIVDNRGGASGTIAAAFVAKSAPDGYTLLHCNIAPNAISLSMYEKLPYEQRDFAAITRFGMTPNIITAHPSTPFRSVKDLAAYARANPAKLSYSAAQVGTSPQLAMEWLKLRMNFNIVHVPYKETTQILNNVIAGHIPIDITNLPYAVTPVRQGRLRALAVTSSRRQPLLPDVPTVQESGVADYEVNSWYGVCAPAGTPATVLDKLNADFIATLQLPEVQRRLIELVITPSPTTREAFDDFIRVEVARWARVIRDAGIPKHP